jgi:hypothetical protein
MFHGERWKQESHLLLYPVLATMPNQTRYMETDSGDPYTFDGIKT